MECLNGSVQVFFAFVVEYLSNLEQNKQQKKESENKKWQTDTQQKNYWRASVFPER